MGERAALKDELLAAVSDEMGTAREPAGGALPATPSASVLQASPGSEF